MIRHYFNVEMQRTRQAAKSFAKQFPDQASLLNLTAEDDSEPDVQRLLEGFAYLTAGIQTRLDDELPEIYECLLTQFWPQLLRPFPSHAIVQLNPQPGLIHQATWVEKGSVVQKTVANIQQSYQFKTQVPVMVLPLQLRRVHCDKKKLALSFQFILLSDFDLRQMQDNPLRFYLHAPHAVAVELLGLLTTQVQSIAMQFDSNESIASKAYFKTSFSRMQDNQQPLHLAQTFFHFTKSFFFVDLYKLASVPSPRQWENLTVIVHLAQPLPVEIETQNFQLYCTPAINLKPHMLQAMNIDQHGMQLPLQLDSAAQDEVIYAVQSIVACDTTHLQRQRLTPLSDFHHGPKQAYYYTTHRDSKARYPQTWLTLGGQLPEGMNTLLGEVLVAQGHAPYTHLREHQPLEASDELPNSLAPLLLSRPTRLQMPIKRPDYHWFLIKQLSLHYQSITDLNTLRQSLLGCDWRTPESNHYIMGITDLQTQVINRIARGVFSKGLQFTVQIDEEQFISWAEVYCFGCMLHQVFIGFAPFDYFVQTNLIGQQSARQWQWQ